MKKTILGIAIILAALGAVIVFNALALNSRQISVGTVNTIPVVAEAAARRLGKALRFKTISHQDPADFKARPFLDFHEFLAATYAAAHATLKRDIVNEYSLLFTWPGSDPSLKPVVLMGHMDVVPVEPGTEDKWRFAPFSGVIAEGHIWGRGALDDKGSVIAIMEAVEALVTMGFEPRRTIYLAFGHDEEIGGRQGARKIAELLAKRGVHAEITVDEGMSITSGMLPGVDEPVALVALAEKGFVSLKLTSRAQGGHSSMPPGRTALGALSRAIAKLEAHQRPAALAGPTATMFEYLAPEMNFIERVLFANRWLFDPLILDRMEKSAASNALVRTTTAPTMIQGGIKENVLPSEVQAVVNFRIIPGETYEIVRDHAISVIDDPDIEVEVMNVILNNPSPVADVNSRSFTAINKSIREVLPDVLVAPGMVLGGTDTVHFREVSDAGYRFVPYRLKAEDFKRVHGTDERVSTENFVEVIKFYGQLIRNLSRAPE
ncbi:MAG: M20 family peptidase [Sphingomonadales bacterium]